MGTKSNQSEIKVKVGCHKCGEPAKSPFTYWENNMLMGGDFCEKHLKEIKLKLKNDKK